MKAVLFSTLSNSLHFAFFLSISISLCLCLSLFLFIALNLTPSTSISLSPSFPLYLARCPYIFSFFIKLHNLFMHFWTSMQQSVACESIIHWMFLFLFFVLPAWRVFKISSCRCRHAQSRSQSQSRFVSVPVLGLSFSVSVSVRVERASALAATTPPFSSINKICVVIWILIESKFFG